MSALKGEGINDLKEYLIKAAKPGDWDFPEDLFTDQDPRETVKQIVKAKFLEVLPSDVPYKISPVIQTWSMDNGVLRLGIQVCSLFGTFYFVFLNRFLVALIKFQQ